MTAAPNVKTSLGLVLRDFVGKGSSVITPPNFSYKAA